MSLLFIIHFYLECHSDPMLTLLVTFHNVYSPTLSHSHCLMLYFKFDLKACYIPDCNMIFSHSSVLHRANAMLGVLARNWPLLLGRGD